MPNQHASPRCPGGARLRAGARRLALAAALASSVAVSGHGQPGRPELLTSLPEGLAGSGMAAQAERLSRLRGEATTEAVSTVGVNAEALRGERLRVSLPGNGVLDLSRSGGETLRGGGVTWSGRVEGAGLAGDATLVARDGDVTGRIRNGRDLYRIEPLGNGVHALVRIDQTRFPPDHEPGTPEPRQRLNRDDLRRAVPGRGETAEQSAGGPVQIDVMVAFTPAAKAKVSDMDGAIAAAVADANQSYANSGVNIRLNMVHSFELAYSESGKSYPTIVGDFAASADANQRRDSAAADLSVLLVDRSTACGRADAILADAASAFAAVHYDCASGNHSFAHELGHLMGARHNPEEDNSTKPFAYGHGFRHDPDWRTIMSYDCPAPGCPRLQFWSNPNVSHNGVAMGTAATHNNARVLNETAATMAAFRNVGPDRFAGVWVKSGADQPVVWGWARKDFDWKMGQMQGQGYRPLAINAVPWPDGESWNAIWVKDGAASDWVWGWARKDFDAKAAQMQQQGYRPIMINAIPTADGGRWNGIWVKDGAAAQWVYGWARKDFDWKSGQMQQQGYRPVMINAVPNTNGGSWNGIWVKDGAANAWVYGWARKDFDWKAGQMQQQGYRPLMINAVSSADGEGWNGIWVKDGAATDWVYGWARRDFEWKAGQMAQQGYRLIDLNAFVLP